MLLHRNLTLICPALIANVLLLAACSPPVEKPSYRGIPETPVAKSFVLQVKRESAETALTHAEIKAKSQSVAQTVGCNVDGIDPIAWEDDVVPATLASSYHLTLKDCELSPDKLESTLQAFSEENFVAGIEAEAIVKASVAENDPGKSKETHLGAVARDAACDAVLAGGKEIVVAVIDSGVDADHPDLLPNFKRDASGNVVGANFVGKGSSGRPDSNWDDQNGHGTHVAGIIAAASNNKIGVSGVAGCANVKIMPVRVMGAGGSGSSMEIDRGIQWAMAHGANVINLSLGSNVSFRSPRASHPNALYEEAAARGVVVFAASGNDGITLGKSSRGYVYSYPASYDRVISVAALDAKNRLASFSNRGETVDIAAPGVNILSTYMGGGYQYLSGTSMACPVAAGVFALASSISHPRDKVSAAVAEASVTQAVVERNLSSRDVMSGGIINTESLVTLLSSSKGPAPIAAEPGDRDTLPPESNPSGEADPAPLTDAPTDSMGFRGLTNGMRWTNARMISVQNWPEDQTAEVRLYWVTARNPNPYSFATLNRDNLSVDGRVVSTDGTYLLYGHGRLVAEAVGANGQSLGTSEVEVLGL